MNVFLTYIQNNAVYVFLDTIVRLVITLQDSGDVGQRTQICVANVWLTVQFLIHGRHAQFGHGIINTWDF